MEIRKLDVTEHGSTRPLYEEVFAEDSQGFVDYYYTEKTKDNQIYVIEEDGDIQTMLHLNPYEMMVNGSRKDADYIVAVATRKTYRKRGYMGELLRRALRDMYALGRSFTFLMPAAETIYTPYDFRTVYEQERKRCPRKESGTLVLEDGRVCRVFRWRIRRWKNWPTRRIRIFLRLIRYMHIGAGRITGVFRRNMQAKEPG